MTATRPVVDEQTVAELQQPCALDFCRREADWLTWAVCGDGGESDRHFLCGAHYSFALELVDGEACEWCGLPRRVWGVQL